MPFLCLGLNVTLQDRYVTELLTNTKRVLKKGSSYWTKPTDNTRDAQRPFKIIEITSGNTQIGKFLYLYSSINSTITHTVSLFLLIKLSRWLIRVLSRSWIVSGTTQLLTQDSQWWPTEQRGSWSTSFIVHVLTSSTVCWSMIESPFLLWVLFKQVLLIFNKHCVFTNMSHDVNLSYLILFYPVPIF